MFGLSLEAILLTVLFVTIIILWRIFSVHRRLTKIENVVDATKQCEDDVATSVRNLETDVQKFVGDEAELFISRVIPTVTKLENFTIAQILQGTTPSKVVDLLVLEKIDKNLAVRVVNQVVYYLDYYNKLPKKQEEQHHEKVGNITIPEPNK